MDIGRTPIVVTAKRKNFLARPQRPHAVGVPTYSTIQCDRRQQKVIALFLFGDAEPFGVPPELEHVP